MELQRLKIDRGARRRSAGKRRWLRWVVALGILFGLIWMFRVPLGRLYDRLALPSVAIGRAARTSPLAAGAVAGTAANGYIVAARRAALSADIAGRIVEMTVEEGSVVKADQVVARLFAGEYRAALDQAVARMKATRRAIDRARAEFEEREAAVRTLEANVTAAKARIADAEANKQLAQLEFDRADKLVAQGTETIAVLDAARTTLQRARASLNAESAALVFATAALGRGRAAVKVARLAAVEAEAQVPVREAEEAQARAALSKTEVRAPFDGIVVLKDAEVGEVVSPNSQGSGSRGSVVTMVDFKSLEVQVDLPETTFAQVEAGDSASIYLDAYPIEPYDGKVTRVWPTANRQKGTIELRVTFVEPDARLRPEMGVRVVFSPKGEPDRPAHAESVVLVSERALVRAGGKTQVFLVERAMLRLIEVSIGEARAGRVVVTRGLEGGETVVVDPANDLRDGMRVRIGE